MQNIDSFLKKKLDTIVKIISSSYKKSQNIGIHSGVSGMFLFQFYYSRYTANDNQFNLGTEMVSYCVELLNSGYSFPTYCNGISGFAWTIQHLQKEGFANFDCDNLLIPFDEYLFKCMVNDLSNGNYDFLHGALGYGVYFLERYENTNDKALKSKYRFYLNFFLQKLETIAISDGRLLKWESKIGIEENKLGINLGLAHGIPSIVVFLTRTIKYSSFADISRKLIYKAADYLLSLEKTKSSHSLFPNWIIEGTRPVYDSRLAWCSGDLGVGISLLKAGKSINNLDLIDSALRILITTTKRKDAFKNRVLDACICHGSYGNSLIYRKISQEFKDIEFTESSNFWLQDGIKKGQGNKGYAGYAKWNGKEESWESDLSLLNGIAGIGLTILEHLFVKPQKWSECLLLY